MQNKTLQRATYFIGISMAIIMAASLFLPALTRNGTSSQGTSIPPTPTPPPPTLPPPITDFSGITFEEDYLHPSGLYSVGVPTGWVPGQPSNNGIQVRTVLNNPNAVSVIEVYLEKPDAPVTTLAELDAKFNENTLRSSWRQYSDAGYEVRSRRLEADRLVIDFSLSDYQKRDYIARHTAWIEGEWIYVVRVVVPRNAPELLFFLMDAMRGQITFYPQFAAVPLLWDAYYDTVDQHIIRRPALWELTDGGDGIPASFEGEEYGGVRLRVEAQPETVADEAAARAWVEALGSTVTVVGPVEPVTRVGGEGFSVAYNAINPDGEGLSGLVVLLNGADGQLHAAHLQIPVPGVDLHSEAAHADYDRVVQALDTFSLLTGLNLFAPEEAPAAES